MMQSRQLVMGVFLFLVTVSCAKSDAVNSASKPKSSNNATTIIGAKIENGKIMLRVPSRGCTEKAHFDVKVEAQDGQNTVTFTRTKQDYCKALIRNGIVLEFPLDELKLDQKSQVVILNPLSS